MTEQPLQQPTEQDWLGNRAKSPAEAYLQGHRRPVTELSSIAKLDILEASHTATANSPEENYLHKGHLLPVTSLRSPEALALMRTRIHTQALLNIAEKQSALAEEALQLALAVEDTARAEVLKATEAIDEFARKTASE